VVPRDGLAVILGRDPAKWVRRRRSYRECGRRCCRRAEPSSRRAGSWRRGRIAPRSRVVTLESVPVDQRILREMDTHHGVLAHALGEGGERVGHDGQPPARGSPRPSSPGADSASGGLEEDTQKVAAASVTSSATTTSTRLPRSRPVAGTPPRPRFARESAWRSRRGPCDSRRSRGSGRPMPFRPRRSNGCACRPAPDRFARSHA